MAQHAEEHDPGNPRPCRSCGSLEPTLVVRFRQNVARVVMVQVSKIEGRYCQGCGDRWFRRMGWVNLTRGWWSPQSLVVTPWFLFANAAQHRRLCRSTGVPSSFSSWLLRWVAVLPLTAMVGLVVWAARR
jgi:protein-S-isoprenylcysteine O-methyltransferase Ste14